MGFSAEAMIPIIFLQFSVLILPALMAGFFLWWDARRASRLRRHAALQQLREAGRDRAA